VPLTDILRDMPVKSITAFLLLIPAALCAQLPAFPTAEGSGMYATGGRGGSVYEVTNLNNAGAGSIVDALSQANRTVVFRVSGTIDLGGVILRPHAYTTIAGQTAPGDGICIKGRIIIGSVTDVVIRYIRVRVDAGAANSSGDAIDIDAGTNIVIDHVSASYARDEGISCQETSDSVTVQWCIISEALTFENHSYGSLVRGDYGDVKSYHHNLYVHNNNRLPRPGNYTATATDPDGLHFDFRNNVVYNWKGNEPGYNADVTATSRYNFVGNVFVSGPESVVHSTAFKESCVDAFAYFADNSYNGLVPADQWTLVVFNGFTTDQITAYTSRSAVTPMPPVTTPSPAEARDRVLASAGAAIPSRDTIDRRLVRDVLQGTGHSIATTAEQPEGAWPPLGSLPAPVDDDHDGMPNAWELANGLNPSNPDDRNGTGTGGYTNLEVYLNTLTGEIVTGVGAPPASVPAAFLLEQNYPNPFNPTTTILYAVPGGVGVSRVTGMSLRVFDVLGRLVATLADGPVAPGTHAVTFDGSGLASGVYFYRLQAGEFVATRRMFVIR
jgi:hypothetical protein